MGANSSSAYGIWCGYCTPRLSLTKQCATSWSWLGVGLAFAVVGVLMVRFATAHYFHVLKVIETGTYEPERRWIIICSACVILMGSGVLYYLFSIPDALARPALILG